MIIRSQYRVLLIQLYLISLIIFLIQADLLLLSTSEPHGICYIETKELDGETNLKPRGTLAETSELGDDLDQITKFDGRNLDSEDLLGFRMLV